tara:strand:- start:284 stop:529 length:246 start_codon:yes stop_codon:yes gene_type:complete
MAKKTHLKDDELKKVQEFVNKLNEGNCNVGILENQKMNLLMQVNQVQEEFNKFQKEIEEIYGKVSINIEDGALSEIKDEKK